MPAFLFPDNQDRLFGREADVTYLVARAKKPGLTILRARPQLGKTWTLYEAGRRLVVGGVIVGYFENPGGASDILKRAVADALTRWVDGANFAQQAKSLLPWLQSEAVIKTGLLVGNLVPALAKVTGALPDGVTNTISGLFGGLADAQTQLKTGGLALQPLEYDQARDIVKMIAGISKKPVALILDAWEKSTDLDVARDILETFLGHSGDWQQCHILLGVRDPDPANPDVSEKAARATDHLAGCSGLAEIHQLQPMNFDDPAEQSRLLTGIRSEVPGAKSMEDGALLGEVEGFPGVLMRWRQKQPDSAEGFTESAGQAREYVYSEFTSTLADSLSDAAFQFAMRVTLMPRLTSDTWKLFRPVIEDGISEPRPAFDELKRLHVLDRELYPTYGHDTRYATAKTWLIEAKRIDPSEEVEGLMAGLAGSVRKVDETDAPYSSAILELVAANRTSIVSRAGAALAGAALSLANGRAGFLDREGVREASLQYPNAIFLLAMGLVNALNDEPDRSRRSDILSELWSLAERYPQEAAIRDRLARGLFNALNSEPDSSGRSDLLKKMQSLADGYPQEGSMRELLAMGLFNALSDVTDPSRGYDLLGELRSLADRYPEEAVVREPFVRALVNALAIEPDPSRGNDLLGELRSLADRYPAETALRDRLADGLVNALYTKPDVSRRSELLNELRSLVDRYPEDAALRGTLAKGLFNVLNTEPDPSGRSDLLNELRSLVDRYPEDAGIRERLACALFNTLSVEPDGASREKLLNELRSLAGQHTDESAVQEQFARGLFNELIDATDPMSKEAIAAELSGIVDLLPEDSEVLKRLREELVEQQA